MGFTFPHLGFHLKIALSLSVKFLFLEINMLGHSFLHHILRCCLPYIYASILFTYIYMFMLLFSLRSLTMPMANQSAASPLTIFYAGKVRVYNAIPREKAQAIMLIAAAAAKVSGSGTCTATAATAKAPAIVGPSASAAAAALGPVLTRCLSLQSSTAGGQPPRPQLIDTTSSALCKLQAELPMARRHSLQRFLEKRRDRMVSKAPYASVKSSDMEGAAEGRPSQLT